MDAAHPRLPFVHVPCPATRDLAAPSRVAGHGGSTALESAGGCSHVKNVSARHNRNSLAATTN